MDIRIDASEFARLGRDIQRLPDDLKKRAFSAAVKRVSSMAATQIKRKIADRLDVPKGVVGKMVTGRASREGEAIVVVRSDWISLPKMGGKRVQAVIGKQLPLNSSYGKAFLAGMKSGHVGVFSRDSGKRLPISEYFGPNPAHDALAHEDEYLKILTDILENHLLNRVLHEVSHRLSRLGAK